MKTKVKLKTEKEITLADLNNSSHVGLIDNDGDKWYIVGTNNNNLCCILIAEGKNKDHPNTFYGGSNKPTIKEVIANVCVNELYVFTTRKELYQWLAE